MSAIIDQIKQLSSELMGISAKTTSIANRTEELSERIMYHHSQLENVKSEIARQMSETDGQLMDSQHATERRRLELECVSRKISEFERELAQEHVEWKEAAQNCQTMNHRVTQLEGELQECRGELDRVKVEDVPDCHRQVEQPRVEIQRLNQSLQEMLLRMHEQVRQLSQA